ncbi:porin family protein [Sphingomonas piscis]|uniref:Porin family protein n=1 Tax=Sphingomonas piscis TaxID=2714943 RepID=A0A6G7YRL6_9SPHN|nr:outer membrane beta-barrel protein [Sphingomonas piscis]QIK79385.1 porin family protein [Sphingomonas piscis]
MRKTAIAVAFATTMLATPAVARDGAWYAGIEGGLLLAEDIDLDYSDPTVVVADGILLDHGTGVDADIIGGYDFGMFRLEAESGYKRAPIKQISVAAQTDLLTGSGAGGGAILDSDGSSKVISGMGNLLLDFGDDEPWSGFVGGGVGLARVTVDMLDIKTTDRALAWQLLAGVRGSITPRLQAGLKYRYFNTRKLDLGNDDAVVPFALSGGKFRSHSLLASLIYNFWTPPAPPPPVVETPVAPPPPATQTCPDGSVILATDACPVPPPPPPPPAPEPERG